jgi:hypothetical protein
VLFINQPGSGGCESQINTSIERVLAFTVSAYQKLSFEMIKVDASFLEVYIESNIYFSFREPEEILELCFENMNVVSECCTLLNKAVGKWHMSR